MLEQRRGAGCDAGHRREPAGGLRPASRTHAPLPHELIQLVGRVALSVHDEHDEDGNNRRRNQE